MKSTLLLSTAETTTTTTRGTTSVTPYKFKSQAQKCEIIKDFDSNDYMSQSKEDETLLGFFNGLCKGTYVEMGALDGKRYSNSWLFNKKFDWKGVMIEPLPTNFEELKKNRPNEVALVNAAVCEKKGTVHFVKADGSAIGGIYEFASKTFRERWWPGINLNSSQVTEVACTPLSEILAEHIDEANYFDFFSLDVEGAELEVVKSIDYDKVGFGIILVEADEHNEVKNEAVISYLESKGYTYFSRHARSDWFYNDEFLNIYKDLWHSKPRFHLS